MILNYAKTKSQGMALLCVILFIFVDFGCHSSSDNNGLFSDTDGDIGDIRLEVRLQGESIPAEIDRFEVSVTGLDIPLFDTNRIAVGDTPQALGLGDLNGDDKLDVVIANFGSNDISVLLGDGRGGFTQTDQSPIAVSTSPRSFPRALGLGDLNGDDKLDVVTANSGSNDISIFLGDGSGGFTAQVPIAVGTLPQALGLDDLNGDGALDVVIANSGSNNISILLGDGRGGFTQTDQSPIAVSTSPQAFPRALGLGDLNGDGVLDVVTANSGSNDISIFLGDGSGGFTAQVPIAVGTLPQALGLDDLNGDGVRDVVIANSGSNDISIFLGDGSGGFTAQVPIAVGTLPRALGLGDLNGDGVRDVVTANSGSNNISILLVDGRGGFTAQVPIAVGASPQALGLGDLNGDGTLDVVTANANSHDISILLGDGRGGFTAQVPIAVGVSPRALGLGDLNGDDKLDVVTANFGSNDISILLGDGRGGFTQLDQSPIAVGVSPRALGLGDLNGDDTRDVVTANAFSNDISILLGDGRGGFTQPDQSPIVVGRAISAIAVASFDDDNGDGKMDSTDFPDLIIANSAGNNISVILNTRFLKNIMTDQEIVFVTIDGRATRAFQLTLQEKIPLGNERSFFVRAFLPGSTTPAFKGHATVNILSPDTRVIVNLNRL